jgi:hypothetical protein
MIQTRSAFVSIAFGFGFAISAAVTGFVPEAAWKSLHYMFVLAGAFVIEMLLGGGSSSVHHVLTYAIAALLHGLFVAAAYSLLLLCIPRMTRRGAALTLVGLLAVDVIFLVLVWPMGELP